MRLVGTITGAEVKITQYCSVCKQSLEMEVVPTGDGEDDGVLWLRCPQCLGFLPKISSTGLKPVAGSTAEATGADADADTDADASDVEQITAADGAASDAADDDGATATATHAAESTAPAFGADPAVGAAGGAGPSETSGLVGDEDAAPGDSAGAAASSRRGKKEEPAEPEEPLAEYAAMLAERDPESAIPYRPWSEYQIGDLIHHLAWDDCGVVVDKETLPGNRQVAKVYFERIGVVRLIEADPSQA